MSLAIAGMGWVTPLGSGVDFVWKRLIGGEEAIAEKLPAPDNRSYLVFRVSAAALKELPSNPRLRRVSAISRFAVAAGLEALKNGGLTIEPNNAQRTALIFAISNGGVIYTRRFYSDIVASGAQAASPLLFPETVFNAPASHLAALLGTSGATYTIVGDGAVGLLAMRMAEDVMQNEELDYCLVVGAEEVDWLLCDAYRHWRLLRSAPPIEPFRVPPRGMMLSEGAGAILLGRDGAIILDQTHPGGDYSKRSAAAEALNVILRELAVQDTNLIVCSANGTFVDQAEAQAISLVGFSGTTYTVKPALGESVGASGVWQVIVAAQALRTAALPPLLHCPAHMPSGVALASRVGGGRSALVINCGLNQQVAGLRLASRS
jgi:3-oxoacyl-(acyl-carrier-protein) synthase